MSSGMIGHVSAATGFRLTVVGCAGSYPGPDSAASCYLVQADQDDRTWNLILDLGNGALGQLQRYIDPLDVDAVLLSHLHADHCIDMTSFYVLRKYHPSGSQPKIPVWGPKRTSKRLARAYDLPRDPGMDEEFEFHRFDGPFTVGPFEVEAFAVDHPVEAFGFRVKVGDKVLAYSGDTGPTPSLLDIAAEADLFLSEASFYSADDNPPSLHLTGADCGEAAHKAGAKRLVLTHIPPWYEAEVMVSEATAAYDGPIDLAAAGVVYEI